ARGFQAALSRRKTGGRQTGAEECGRASQGRPGQGAGEIAWSCASFSFERKRAGEKDRSRAGAGEEWGCPPGIEACRSEAPRGACQGAEGQVQASSQEEEKVAPAFRNPAGGGRARVAAKVGTRSQGQVREIRNGGLSRRGETGWLARTQGGREPQRGSMPREDSRPTE